MNQTRVWDAPTGALRGMILGPRGRAAALSPDGKLLAVGEPAITVAPKKPTAGRTVRLWDTSTWGYLGLVVAQQPRLLGRHEDSVSAVAFSRDGSLLVSAGADRTLRLWDVASGGLLVVVHAPYPVQSIAFSPDGALLAATGSDWQIGKPTGRVDLFRVHTPEQ